MACFKCIPTQHFGFPTFRKAINQVGGLGSFYDAEESVFTKVQSFESEKNKPIEEILCRKFDGKGQLKLSSFMCFLGFEGSDIENFAKETCELGNIANSSRTGRIIGENVRLFHYVYRDRQIKLKVNGNTFNRRVPLPKENIKMSHVVTKIILGIEFLFIIEITSRASIEDVDKVLGKIRDNLLSNDGSLSLDPEDRHQLALFSKITVYGSENCLSTGNFSFFQILELLPKWRSTKNLHEPIDYVFQPVNILYSLEEISVKNFKFQLERIDVELGKLRNLMSKMKKNRSNRWLNNKFDQLQNHFIFLLDQRENFAMKTSPAVGDYFKPKQIENFRIEIENFIGKIDFIDELEREQIRYVDLVDFLVEMKQEGSSLEQISSTIKEKFPQVEIFLFSNEKFRETKKQEIFEFSPQTSTDVELQPIYFDFTNSTIELDDLKIVRK